MKQRRFNVRLEVEGEVNRQVLAKDEAEATRKVVKMLFGEDETTPKSNYVQAFFWKRGYCSASVDYRDWTDEDQEAHDAEIQELMAKTKKNQPLTNQEQEK